MERHFRLSVSHHANLLEGFLKSSDMAEESGREESRGGFKHCLTENKGQLLSREGFKHCLAENKGHLQGETCLSVSPDKEGYCGPKEQRGAPDDPEGPRQLQTEGTQIIQINSVQENLLESKILENFPESQILENLLESQILENLPESQILENLPESQILENLPESEILENLPDSEILENLPESEILENLPDSEILENLPESQILRSSGCGLTSADKENLIPAVLPACDGGVQGSAGPAPVATEASHDDSLSQRSEEAGSAAGLTPGRQVDTDEEVVRRAREEGLVHVVFPGSVNQEGCCRIICEVLKCILYQRQQLPMTYDQLVFSQKSQQDIKNKELVGRTSSLSTVLDRKRCQRTLQDLEDLLQHLEVLFSLSLVPRVLLLLGGSTVLPKELYEVNMEAVLQASGGRSLRTSTCLRHVFRTLFVADVLSDTRPVRLLSTTVMVLAHRDCGVDWFRPKLEYRVPTRVKSQVIALASDPGFSEASGRDVQDWQEYVWFQAPVAIKGFSK